MGSQGGKSTCERFSVLDDSLIMGFAYDEHGVLFCFEWGVDLDQA